MKVALLVVLLVAPLLAQDLDALEARRQSESRARSEGTRQLLFGHRIARDNLKLAIESLRRDLAGATNPAARTEIESRIASTVASLNDLRASQAAEVESRARETALMEASFDAERDRIRASARIQLDDRQATAAATRDAAAARADAARRAVSNLEALHAARSLDLETARRAALSRRQLAVDALRQRVQLLQEPLPDLRRRAAATTYLDDRARLEREAAAVEAEVASAREDAALEARRQEAVDAGDLATRAAALADVAGRLAIARDELARAGSAMSFADAALQAARSEARRFENAAAAR